MVAKEKMDTNKLNRLWYINFLLQSGTYGCKLLPIRQKIVGVIRQNKIVFDNHLKVTLMHQHNTLQSWSFHQDLEPMKWCMCYCGSTTTSMIFFFHLLTWNSSQKSVNTTLKNALNKLHCPASLKVICWKLTKVQHWKGCQILQMFLWCGRGEEVYVRVTFSH